jgi:hypothetical protein
MEHQKLWIRWRRISVLRCAPPSGLVPRGAAAGRARKVRQHRGEGARVEQGPDRFYDMLQGLLCKIRGPSAFPLFLEGLLVIITLLMYYKQHR